MVNDRADMESGEEGAAEIIERMVKAIGGHTQADLSKVLGVSAASISAARRKGKIPPEWIVKLAISRHISPAWVKYDHGPQIMIFPTRRDSAYDKMTYIVQAASRFSEVIEVRNNTKKTIDYLILSKSSPEYFKLGLRYDKPSDDAKINLIRTTCWDVGVIVKQVEVPDKKLHCFKDEPDIDLSVALDWADASGDDLLIMLEAYIKEAGAIIEEIKPGQQSDVTNTAELKLLNDHSIYELLNMASKVLESETIYKSSLLLSIKALYKALQAEEHFHE